MMLILQIANITALLRALWPCFWGLKNKHFWLRGCGPSLYIFLIFIHIVEHVNMHRVYTYVFAGITNLAPWFSKLENRARHLLRCARQRRWTRSAMGRSDMGVSKNRGTTKSSILIGFPIINHPFWGTPIFGNTHMGNTGYQGSTNWWMAWAGPNRGPHGGEQG